MQITKTIFFENCAQWRSWLEENHSKEKEIWLIFYRKSSDVQGVQYKEALEEAICFGWIDGTLKKIDEKKRAIRFTPRREKSAWSKINKDIALRMTREKRMAPAGLSAVKHAKKNGAWAEAYTSKKKLEMPPDLETALASSKNALKNFNSFANTYRNMYVGWVTGAKTEETRKKRIAAVVENAEKGKKLAFY